MQGQSIKISGLIKRYGTFLALNDVTLDIPAGGFTVLLGPSGSGKTTLLSILGGFTVPEQGSVTIGGQDVTAMAPAARPTTTVFQDYALFPHMSIGNNIGFGLRMRGIGKVERDAKAKGMLALVGLPDAFEKKPHQLSGGQRQRVALARALAVDPAVLLLDEPLGALDLKLRRQMQDELKAIQRRVGTTFVHVTHDQEEAMAIADTIVVLNRGRIEDMGAPERVYLKPRSRFAAEFMGTSALIAGAVKSIAEDRICVGTAIGDLEADHAEHDAVKVGEAVLLSLRPEDLQTVAGPEMTRIGEVDVTDVTFLGTHRKIMTRHRLDPAFEPALTMAHGIRCQIGDILTLYVKRSAVAVIRAA
jgi:spermidine/putrescine transport system ATP-binding protein